MEPPIDEDAVAMIERHEQEWQAHLAWRRARGLPLELPPAPPEEPDPMLGLEPDFETKPEPVVPKPPPLDEAADDWARWRLRRSDRSATP